MRDEDNAPNTGKTEKQVDPGTHLPLEPHHPQCRPCHDGKVDNDRYDLDGGSQVLASGYLMLYVMEVGVAFSI